MKGVILAGGTGSRLAPLTKVTNKHLLPVYNKPMIYYPIETLKKAGITEILIVSGGEHIGDFMKLLGSGQDFGCDFTYRVQDGAGGIPVALGLAKQFVGKEKFVAILGDNVMENDISEAVNSFQKSNYGAMIFLREVDDPKRFGIAEIFGDKVVKAYEKPDNPVTNLAILGVYMFDHKSFEVIPNLRPSRREELEITDVINYYIERNELTFSMLNGFWVDAGKFDSLHKANLFIASKHENKEVQ